MSLRILFGPVTAQLADTLVQRENAVDEHHSELVLHVESPIALATRGSLTWRSPPPQNGWF